MQYFTRQHLDGDLTLEARVVDRRLSAASQLRFDFIEAYFSVAWRVEHTQNAGKMSDNLMMKLKGGNPV